MSSTEVERQQMLLALFDGYLLPASERLAQRGICLFPLDPDPTRETYYSERANKLMRPRDFVLDLENLNHVKTHLESLWTETPLPEIPALLEKLLALAPAHCEKRDPDEISPFIYAMF